MKYYFYVYLFTQENCAAQINMAACCKLAVYVFTVVYALQGCTSF